MNTKSLERLVKVHPELHARILLVAKALEAQGITIEVVQGLRTFAQQDDLFAQGRSKPGHRVTNARGGQSNHNYGLAVDVCPFVNSEPDWENDATFKKIGAVGVAHGLEWGGNWHALVDMPHLQLGGLTIHQCLDLYRQGGLVKVWAAVKL